MDLVVRAKKYGIIMQYNVKKQNFKKSNKIGKKRGNTRMGKKKVKMAKGEKIEIKN